MKEHDFKDQDQKMMDAMQSRRDKKVPWEIQKGFAASVEEKILERGKKRSFGWFPERAWVPAAVPVFAVLVLAVVVTLRLPDRPAPVTGMTERPASTFALAPTVELAQAVPGAAEDIAALRELGEWSDEEEVALGEFSAEDLASA